MRKLREALCINKKRSIETWCTGISERKFFFAERVQGYNENDQKSQRQQGKVGGGWARYRYFMQAFAYMQSKKAPTFPWANDQMLKLRRDQIMPELCSLFNCTVSAGRYLGEWKLANVSNCLIKKTKATSIYVKAQAYIATAARIEDLWTLYERTTLYCARAKNTTFSVCWFF